MIHLLMFIFITFLVFVFWSDVSSTLIVTPGPVMKFLTDNQGVRDQSFIDWKKVLSRISMVCLRLSKYLFDFVLFVKAERTLKNLRVKVSHSNREYKITGLTRLPCRDQTYVLNWYLLILWFKLLLIWL